jgi:hypothetical protein
MNRVDTSPNSGISDRYGFIGLTSATGQTLQPPYLGVL